MIKFRLVKQWTLPTEPLCQPINNDVYWLFFNLLYFTLLWFLFKILSKVLTFSKMLKFVWWFYVVFSEYKSICFEKCIHWCFQYSLIFIFIMFISSIVCWGLIFHYWSLSLRWSLVLLSRMVLDSGLRWSSYFSLLSIWSYSYILFD